MSKEQNILTNFEKMYQKGASENLASEVPDMFDTIIEKSSINKVAPIANKKSNRKVWYGLAALSTLAILLFLFSGNSDLNENVGNEITPNNIPEKRLESNHGIESIIDDSKTKNQQSSEESDVEMNDITPTHNSMHNSDPVQNVNSPLNVENEETQLDEIELIIPSESNDLLEEENTSIDLSEDNTSIENSETETVNSDSEKKNLSPFDSYIKNHAKKDSLDKLFKDK